jgi:4-hydroxy-3-polyprenylbenzoate decarboxylase
VKRLIVGIGDGTGVIYAIRLLEALRGLAGVETQLLISPAARRTIVEETGTTPASVEALATRSDGGDETGEGLDETAASAAGMVVAPCGAETLAAIATTDDTTAIARAADRVLTVGRPLVLVVLETPLHIGALRRLRALAGMGAVIVPALPAFYPRPQTVEDVIGHTVGRVLDRVGIAPGLVAEWTGTGRVRRRGTSA